MLNGVDPTLLSRVLLFGFLGMAVAWDLHRRRIPNFIPVALASAGLGMNLWLWTLDAALLMSIGGLLVGSLLWLPPYMLRAAGAADLKLVAAVGVWLGPLGVLRASLYAALVGGVLALLWLWRSGGLLGIWVYLETALRTRRRNRTGRIPVPYAVAIAAGVALELVPLRVLGGLR